MSAEDDARHANKMAKKKVARDKIMATKTDKKGLIIVHTGKGKGKSSAAFGMIFRCIAHDMKCAVVQFIKGGMSILPVVGPSPLSVNPIFEIGPLEPRYSEWLVFEGVSVDEKGVQHYLGKF